MTWNWQQPGWPDFTHDSKALEPLEQQFLLQSGEFIGAFRHIGPDDQETFKIELISDEAVKTSEIEGEILDRASVQSSLRHQLGLGIERPGLTPAERGISEMMLDLYRSYATPLADQTMFDWHAMLLSGDRSIKVVGGYRTHAEPMQVISGPEGQRRVHSEAPPSKRLPGEMKRFIAWFNDTAPGAKNPLPALTRAGIAHLYFVSIHPFDGNGRIGRALAEKSLAQNLAQPSLIALAYTIERKRRDYYGPRSAEQHARSRGFLRRQGPVLRKAAREAQRTAGEGRRPHVRRGNRRLHGRPQREELYQHQQGLARDRDA